MFGTLVVFILLSTIHANPIYDTTAVQVNTAEISTASKEVLDNTTVTELLENRTTSTLNVTSIPIIANIGSLILNSTAPSGIIQGKVVTYNTTTYYYTDYATASTSSSTGLSGGAIAGIVIGMIILICCCACAGVGKGGHWEDAKVWVSH